MSTQPAPQLIPSSPGRLSRFLPNWFSAEPNAPNEVLGTPHWKSLIASAFVHFGALSGCIILIVLDRIRFYCFEDDKPNVLNSLQLSAKLLELFMLTSLSLIILKYAKYHLTDTAANGLPLGMLSSVYRTTDFMLIFEPSLWFSFDQAKTMRLGVMVMFTAVYSILVGPATAVLMIPNRGPTPYPGAFGNSTGRILFFRQGENASMATFNTRDYIYPSHLSANSSFDAMRCSENEPNELQDTVYRRCPGSVYSDVFLWAWQPPYNGSTGATEPGFGNVYHSLSGHVDEERPSTTIRMAASVPHEMLLRTFGALWNGGWVRWPTNFPFVQSPRLSVSKESSVYQPVVLSKCEFLGNSVDLDLQSLHVSSDGMLAFNAERGWHNQTGTTWSVPKESIDRVLARSMHDTPQNQTSYLDWIEAEALGSFTGLSIATLISIPPREPDLEIRTSQIPNQRVLLSCIFSAFWMPTDITLDARDQDPQINIATNWTDAKSPSKSVLTLFRNISSDQDANLKLPRPLDLITIDYDWMSLLRNISDLLRDQIRAHDILDRGEYWFPDGTLNTSNTRFLLGRVSHALIVPLTLGLASHGADDPWAYLFTSRSTEVHELKEPTAQRILGPDPGLDLSTLTDFPNVYELTMLVDRNGYAYGRRAASVRFGLAIICIYMIVLGSHLIYSTYLLARYRDWHVVTSLSGVHDIITLAMNSQPPQTELVNCGAGVEDRNTWRQNIKVRAPKQTNGDDDTNQQANQQANQQSNQLQLIFDRPNMEPVRAGNKYA